MLAKVWSAIHLITGSPGVTIEDLEIADVWRKELMKTAIAYKTPTIGYWGIRGNAAAARYIMKYAKADYKPKDYMSPDEWFGEKFNLGMDFPNLVYVIAGDYKVTESAACYLYLAARHCPDLTGKDAHSRGVARMLENVVNSDYNAKIRGLMYS
mmetsp:Transcript_3620/g.2361  ORF Transcript_3620/g.2361 Transcript_3620/m.2361 type:complete len:154 (+) Transcript_3620:1020-1481(+)|eukprot:CAMPEP_0116879710 /NCGR_PEP_ID=MMETSP0463-20121206/11522_1 /TAXON_ID=181622 /ORGANISM="Strombidinopsis sp, Strain SopsisLIS2011" /LENGTH=153 /DNA_ID=CAMNT_0004529327 /DNA_START=1005 /DNA_END=1466 /DNA_ORIENTATION=-